MVYFSSLLRVLIALNLLQMLALVTQQALVVLVAWQGVDRAPEAGPASESCPAHEPGQWAGGGVDVHGYAAL